MYRKLRDRGILVRYFGTGRIRDFVRISIGTPEQMEILARNLKEILAEQKDGGYEYEKK